MLATRIPALGLERILRFGDPAGHDSPRRSDHVARPTGLACAACSNCASRTARAPRGRSRSFRARCLANLADRIDLLLAASPAPEQGLHYLARFPLRPDHAEKCAPAGRDLHPQPFSFRRNYRASRLDRRARAISTACVEAGQFRARLDASIARGCPVRSSSRRSGGSRFCVSWFAMCSASARFLKSRRSYRRWPTRLSRPPTNASMRDLVSRFGRRLDRVDKGQAHFAVIALGQARRRGAQLQLRYRPDVSVFGQRRNRRAASDHQQGIFQARRQSAHGAALHLHRRRPVLSRGSAPASRRQPGRGLHFARRRAPILRESRARLGIADADQGARGRGRSRDWAARCSISSSRGSIRPRSTFPRWKRFRPRASGSTKSSRRNALAGTPGEAARNRRETGARRHPRYRIRGAVPAAPARRRGAVGAPRRNPAGAGALAGQRIFFPAPNTAGSPRRISSCGTWNIACNSPTTGRPIPCPPIRPQLDLLARRMPGARIGGRRQMAAARKRAAISSR